MTPSEYNLPNQYKGDTFDGIEFQMLYEDTKEGLNLGGNTKIDIQFRGGFQNDSVIKKISVKDGGVVITNPSGGVFKINPFLVDWEAGTYIYDIQITFPTGEVKTFLRGSVIVETDVTKS